MNIKSEPGVKSALSNYRVMTERIANILANSKHVCPVKRDIQLAEVFVDV